MMLKIGVFLLSLCLWSGAADSVLAATDEVTISQVVSSDQTPPTTPTIISTLPVATTQIDVTWSTSTDDVLLAGYQVFRDAVQIATTTLVSYSDTGLAPSTAYSYTVRAFDTSKNYSTSSDAVATTTLSLPGATTTSTSNSGGSKLDVELLSFDIATEEKSALITWVTDRYTQYSLRWGRTYSYELGYVTTEVFSREHSTNISDLEPGTVYEYELTGYDRDGRSYDLSKGRFKTESAPDTIAPPNISNFQAVVIGDDVHLSWTNPAVDDFAFVRIVRSYLFYPTDPYGGYIVYQDDGEEVVNEQAFETGTVQYYTAFAYDTNGNISSGAVTVVKKVNTSGDEGLKDETDSLPTSTMSQTDTVLDDISFADFEIIQDGQVLTQGKNEAQIEGWKPVTVRVPYDAFPEHLKTITVTFTHPEDKDLTFSFLLRVNKDKTAYEAVIAPFHEDGLFMMDISVFDYKTKVIKEVSGSLVSEYDESEVNKTTGSFFKPVYTLFFSSLLSLTTIIVLYLLLFRRRDRK